MRVAVASYLSTEEDRRVAADSLRLARRICAQPALARYRAPLWGHRRPAHKPRGFPLAGPSGIG